MEKKMSGLITMKKCQTSITSQYRILHLSLVKVFAIFSLHFFVKYYAQKHMKNIHIFLKLHTLYTEIYFKTISMHFIHSVFHHLKIVFKKIQVHAKHLQDLAHAKYTTELVQ